MVPKLDFPEMAVPDELAPCKGVPALVKPAPFGLPALSVCELYWAQKTKIAQPKRNAPRKDHFDFISLLGNR